MIFPKLCDVCKLGVVNEPRQICGICGWEDDPVQRKDAGFRGGANSMSLREFREDYLRRKNERN